MDPIGLGIFVLAYGLISARRLRWLGFDRPAGALLGAVLYVVVGHLRPADAIAAVDGPTLLLLFGVMGMGAFLGLDGFFDRAERLLLAWARTPARLLGVLVWGAGLLAALITNDAVCVLGTPLVVRLVQRQGLPALPFLLALATAANTGSVATLVGTPQNMLCAMLGGLSYREHLLLVGPVALVGLLVNHGLLLLLFARPLREARASWDQNGPDAGPLEAVPGAEAARAVPGAEASAPPTRRRGEALVSRRHLITLSVIAGSALAYTAGLDLAWTATAGFVLLMLVHRRDTRQLWGRIDWSLLLFFAGLFVVVEGFIQSGGPAWFFARFPLAGQAAGPPVAFGWWEWTRLSAIFLLGSNIVSNVPFILVVRDQMASLPSPTLAWELLTVASTFAGNLTLLGSVANIIVAEQGREVGGLGFWQYLRLGLPLALLTTALGTAWLVLVGA